MRCFVGLRSGVFDFLAMTSAKTLTVSPFNAWDCDLNILHPGCSNRTFYSAVEYLKPLLEHIPQDFGVRFEIRISHDRINSADVYFSYEDILAGILDAVG